MIKKSASAGMILLVVFLAAIYLPHLYAVLFFDKIEKTHLFYSPVTKDFLLKEKVVGPVPEAVRQKAEDHHAGIKYQEASGEYLSRVEFEKRLPFIFYRNMEIWGLLPVELAGRSFAKAEIKESRRVLELKSTYLAGNHPRIPAWPLLESNPGQARLIFPDDRFRMIPDAIQVINADSNQVDSALSQVFTRALTEKGFVFPARSVNGKFTVLKPFDEGVFLVDHNFSVFHLKRVNGQPKVFKTPVSPSIQTRHIQVSENKQKQFYGLLLDHSGGLYLMSYDQYRLTRLPLKGYDPDRMDFKLIFNPLNVTAVYSDHRQIHAVAMDRDFQVLDRFSHTMSRSGTTVAGKIYSMLFPFSLHLDSDNGGFLKLRFSCSGWPGLAGILICFLGYGVNIMRSEHKRLNLWPVLLIAASGIFGMTAILFSGEDA